MLCMTYHVSISIDAAEWKSFMAICFDLVLKVLPKTFRAGLSVFSDWPGFYSLKWNTLCEVVRCIFAMK